MRRSVDTWLGALLWLNALVFVVGSLAAWSFDQWFFFDIVAVIVCGAIGFAKRIRLLQAIAAVIVAGMLLRLSTALWLVIDSFIIGACLYAGYFLLKSELQLPTIRDNHQRTKPHKGDLR
jgi:hypothetical protein